MALLLVATTLLLPTAFAARGISTHRFANVRKDEIGLPQCFNMCVYSDECEDGCEEDEDEASSLPAEA
ncbi:hypothetical protein CCACVL1_26242 [Corchorus capsularis]|uniref:Uncharacterized protein n=1 Tax=Corchorus capsularis TaxID=210143 RepID=A0A1R3GFG9_COCAP|nr:hypothetical protein CCACVL1_26242 [Corchorus capsularis]